jgi:hypothetical protein
MSYLQSKGIYSGSLYVFVLGKQFRVGHIPEHAQLRSRFQNMLR